MKVSRNEHMLADLALGLLVVSLKRDALPLGEQGVAEMLDPFVGVSRRLLLSTHDTVVSAALNVLSHLIKASPPLPALRAELPTVVANIFFLLQRAGSSAAGGAVRGCLRALTVILRLSKARVHITQPQLKVLLSFAQQDLFELQTQSVAFGLLRAIIARRLVCEEVYDLIDKVAEHMITSQSEQTQQLSAQALLQFLLEYPLGDKRLLHHLQFLLRSLEYEYESGRKMALEVLHRVVARLPMELLETYVQLIFLSLVVRLVNDDAPTCRRMVALLLKDLLARCPKQEIDTLLDVALGWLQVSLPSPPPPY